jgi:cytochrome c-type biogenesis protein
VPDPQELTNIFAQGSVWALPLAFTLGLLATLTPSTFPLAPVIVGYVGTGARSRGAAWGRALAFLGGLTLVNVGVGAFFGAAGALAQELVGGNLAVWNALAGLMTLLTGLGALGWLHLPLPALGIASNPTGTWQGAFVLGLPFGLVTCPTCVPLLVPLALGAAVTRLAWYGGLLFLAFAIGRGIPLLILGGAAGLFKGLKGVARAMPTIERGAALLLLLAAVYFFVEAVRWLFWQTLM